MKIYLSPETKSLQVNAQTFLCGSGPTPAPTRSGQLGTATRVNVSEAWI